MAVIPMPDFVAALVDKAVSAIMSDLDGFKALDGHDKRDAAAHLLRARWTAMTEETKARLMLLDAVEEIVALGPTVASWRLVVLARGLHVLSEYLRSAVDIPGVPAGGGLGTAAELVRDAGMSGLELKFPRSSLIIDAAAERLITSNLFDNGWRGKWNAKVCAGAQGDRTVVTAALTLKGFDVSAYVATKEMLRENYFVLFDLSEFDERAQTSLYQLCTHASAEAWLLEQAAAFRANAEALTLQAAQKIQAARKYDAAARTQVTAKREAPGS